MNGKVAWWCVWWCKLTAFMLSFILQRTFWLNVLRALLALIVPVQPSGAPPTLPAAQDPICGCWRLPAPSPALFKQVQYPAPTALPCWAPLSWAHPQAHNPAWPQPNSTPRDMPYLWGWGYPGADQGWWERPWLSGPGSWLPQYPDIQFYLKCLFSGLNTQLVTSCHMYSQRRVTWDSCVRVCKSLLPSELIVTDVVFEELQMKEKVGCSNVNCGVGSMSCWEKLGPTTAKRKHTIENLIKASIFLIISAKFI